MKKIKVGILGYGVVGSELVDMILNNRERVKQTCGVDLEPGKVLVRSLDKVRKTNHKDVQLTVDWKDIVTDPCTDIVCECIGGAGTEQTKDYVFKAVENGKSLVMSSKKVVALYGDRLLETILKNGVQFRFDATVGGGIPVAKILRECFKGEKIRKVIGILNATSNFIYSRMEKDGVDFKTALKNAQELGYAENDPSEDLNGYDALYKAIILIMFSMKKWTDIRQFKTTPFSSIDVLDMHYARELGYHIKPLVVVEDNGSLVYRIGPCLIRENHIAANTYNNYNIVVFEGSNTGLLGFYGQGAGSKPTASAMFDDLISIINTRDEQVDRLNRELFGGIKKASAITEYRNNLYWRITVRNTIGMFAHIASAMACNNVNIEKIIQKNEIDNRIGIVLLTSSVDVETMNRIIEDFGRNDITINTIMPFVED